MSDTEQQPIQKKIKRSITNLAPSIVKSLDCSYDDAETTLSSKTADPCILEMIKEWVGFRRVKTNSIKFGFKEQKETKVLNYLKHYYQVNKIELEAIRQHYTFYCTQFRFHADYCNMHNPLNDILLFHQEFTKATPEEIPKGKYYGPTWQLHEPCSYIKHTIDSPIKRSLDLVPKISLHSKCQIRGPKSPFPGHVVHFPLTISNLGTMNTDKSMKVIIESYLTPIDFENLYKNFGLDVPEQSEESVKKWIEKMLECFCDTVKSNGIKFVN